MNIIVSNIGKLMKTAILLVFILALTMGFGLPATGATSPADVQGHWAQSQIENVITRGIAGGYLDNTFKPDEPITRAEFMTMINKAFSFTNIVFINYPDVNENDWFAPEIAKAKAAEYIGGYPDGSMKPNDQISRQEVAAILTKILKLDTSNSAPLPFNDNDSIPTWSRSSVAVLYKAGYIGGYPDGSIKVMNPITRAEAAILISNSMGANTSVYNQAGTYGPQTGTTTIHGDVTISALGIILQNTIIKGNLIIAESVGDGEVTLKNVTVNGNTIINGGGPHSITADGSTLGSVTSNQPGVHIACVNGTTVVSLTLANGATVTVAPGSTVEGVTVSTTGEVGLSGNFGSVTVDGANANVTVASGSTVTTFTVEASATGATVNVTGGAAVTNLIANTATTVSGTGNIAAATINAANVTIAQTPTNVTAALGVTYSVAGTQRTGTGMTVTTPTSGNGTGTGGGVAPLNLVSSNPVDGSIDVASTPTITLTFDRGVVRDHWDINQNCITMKNSSNYSVPITVFRVSNYLDDSEKSNIYVSPNGSLNAGETYTIIISAGLTANNDNTLGTSASISFTVAGGGGGGGGGDAPTAVLSGTVSSAAPTKGDIVAGGKTIIITLSNGSFASQVASSQIKREALLDGLSAGSETAEWAKVIAATKATGASAVTHDSDTKVTITLSAAPTYNITANQTISMGIPSGSITGVSSTVNATPTFTVNPVLLALSGTVISATPSEEDIVSGGKTIVLTLTNGAFADQIATNQAKRYALLDSLSAGSETTEWAEVIAATKASQGGAISRDSDTQVTITLTATPSYNITSNQTITLATSTSGIISGVSVPVRAIPTFTITSAGDPVVTAAIGGTIQDASKNNKSDIVNGGSTIILDLLNDTWVPAELGTQFSVANAKSLVAGITGNGNWSAVTADLNTEIDAVNTAVVRTSDTRVTITLPVVPTYSISSNETVTIAIPNELLVTTTSGTVAGDTILTIVDTTISTTITGNIQSGNKNKEADIVAGGSKIIIDMVNDTWEPAESGTKFSVANAKSLVAGITGNGNWSVVTTALNTEIDATNTSVVRTSNTRVTITLPPVPGYSISSNETISIAIPNELLVTTASGTVAGNTTLTVVAGAEVTITGTIQNGAKNKESDIVLGAVSKIIINLANDSWEAAESGTKFSVANAKMLVAGITGIGNWAAVTEALNTEIDATNAAVVRTSDVKVTITIPAVPAYSIDSDETINIVVPNELLVTTAAGTVAGTPSLIIINQ